LNSGYRGAEHICGELTGQEKAFAAILGIKKLK